MSSKICLLLLGALVLFAVFSSSSAEEENSVSEDVSAARLVREASADPKKKKSRNSARRSRKGKRKAKKNDKKNKKSRKSNKSKKSAKKSKKSKKSGKKSRKNKKKSRKSKKSSKKSRKNKKKKSSKKSKKNRKNNKKGDERISSRAIDTKCVAQLTLSMRRWKDVVTNFQRQSKRITDNQNKGDGKSGKQSVFAPIASRLVSTGGGNSSALTCGGSSTSDGALALTKLAKDMGDCEKSVNDSCHTANMPAANTTLIDECTTLTDKFVEEATKCLVMSKDESKAAEGCACWTDAALTKLTEDVNKCKVKDDMDAIKAQLKACTKAFGACRKLEDAAVESLHACTTHPDEHIKMAATLSAHKEALGNVKSHLSTLSGSRRSRVIRAPATTCAGIVEIVDKLLTLVEEFPSHPEFLDHHEDILNSNVQCSNDEKELIKNKIIEIEAAEETMQGHLDVHLSAVELHTGSTPSAESLAGALTTMPANGTMPMTTGNETMRDAASDSRVMRRVIQRFNH